MAGAVDVLARVPISFEVAGGTTHAPTVTGRFDGLETRLVLDTGSEVHLLTKELVDRLGLEVAEGEEGVDHSGATMPSWAVEDVPLRLGELGLTLHDIVAIPSPAAFRDGGIGGILSPQHLHPSAAVVIDLAQDELLLVEGADTDVAAWLAQRSPALTTLVLERNERFATVVVRAAVTPHAEIPTLLNTGGKRTEFSSAAVPGRTGAVDERLGGGVSGANVVGTTVGEATLAVGGLEFPVASLAVRESMHDPQGLVGMDVLRGTALAVAANVQRPVVWQVPVPDR